jgi:hypothetical protein
MAYGIMQAEFERHWTYAIALYPLAHLLFIIGGVFVLTALTL